MMEGAMGLLESVQFFALVFLAVRMAIISTRSHPTPPQKEGIE